MFTAAQIRNAFPMQTPRTGQLEAITQILEAFDKYPNVIYNGPTGAGKSQIAYTVASLLQPAYLSSPLVTLVTQYANTKEFTKLHTITGRRNYACHATIGLTTCAEKMCRLMNKREGMGDVLQCTYDGLMMETMWRPLLNCTLSLLLAGSMRPRNFIVIDEAHMLWGPIRSDYEVELRSDTVKIPPEVHATLDGYLPWLKETLKSVGQEASSLEERIMRSTGEGDDHADVLKLRRLEGLLGKLMTLCSAKHEWAIDDNPEYYDRRFQRVVRKVTFKPVEVKRLIKESIFPLGKKRLFMSATPPTADELGLTLGTDCGYVESPSLFPTENRLVVFKNVAKMGYRNREANVNKVAKEIVTLGGDGKVLVQCPSHVLKNLLAREMQALGASFMMQESESREYSLEKWKQSTTRIYLATGSYEGVDLPNELCRFVVFPAIPYPNEGDPVVKRRIELEGRGWYYADAARKIVQGAGRGVRHEKDFCMTIIMPSEWNALWGQHLSLKAKDNVGLFPAWWTQAYVPFSTKVPT